MTDVKMVPLLGLFVLSSFNFPAFSAAQSTISLEVGADNNDGKTYYLFGRHKFENGIQIKASAGESKTTDSLNEKLTSTLKNIGIQSDQLALFSVGLEKSRLLQVSTLETDSTIVTLTMNTDNWNIFISPITRDVSVETTRFQRTINFDSDGLAAGATYYGWDPAYLSFSRITYDYPAKLSEVNDRINLFTYIFGSSTVDQVFALEDQRETLELGYFFHTASIALSRSRGQSALDNSISTIDKIYLSYHVSDNWTLGAVAGVSKIDISNTTTQFVSMSLGYKW